MNQNLVMLLILGAAFFYMRNAEPQATIARMRAANFTDEQIRIYMRDAGYTDEQIDGYLA